jgi:class 3 adenylate cyclase
MDSATVVGYSSLMEADEAGTFARLKAGRQELFEPEIARHHGRVFKLMGDGFHSGMAIGTPRIRAASARR